MKNICLLTAMVFLSSCSTLIEMADPNDRGNGYQSTKNQKGETVEVRSIVKPSAPVYPIIYPPALPINAVPTPMEQIASENIQTGSSAVATPKNDDDKMGAYIEYAHTKENTHIGFHVGGPAKETFVPRGGISMFNSASDLFYGGDLSGRFYFGGKPLKGIAGAGVYFGDSKKCTSASSNGQTIDRCEKKFLTAAYVELGLEFKQVSIFWRDYRVNRAGISIPTESFWGLGIRF